MLNLEELEKKINLNFKNKDLLKLAFIHRSYLNETKNKEHNERIEFLGDAVLELLASEMLFKKFPKMPEGEMTQLRSALVNTISLSIHAEKLELGKYLQMSKGEKKSEKGRQHILANTFEALIGAIYLEFGLEKSREFLENNLFGYLDEIIKNSLHKDPKSYLQEITQEKIKITPSYKVLDDFGPEHDKEYLVAVYFGDKKIAEGKGSSKKKAEINSAQNALKILENKKIKDLI